MEAKDEMTPVQKKSLGLSSRWVEILFCCAVLAVIAATLLPTFSSNYLKENLVVASSRGRDIYVSIVEANEKRKSLGLPPIWPQTCLATTNLSQDISGMTFKTSTEYFKVLFDEEHMGTDAWKPYVKGVDYSKLAGMGVPVSEKQRLTSTNNMWAIAANITEDDDDIIPVFISRNADVKAIEGAVNGDFMSRSADVKIALGTGDYQTPFGDKGFVYVRKGGGQSYIISKYATIRVFFLSSGRYRPRDPSKPKIVYLMP